MTPVGYLRTTVATCAAVMLLAVAGCTDITRNEIDRRASSSTVGIHIPVTFHWVYEPTRDEIVSSCKHVCRARETYANIDADIFIAGDVVEPFSKQVVRKPRGTPLVSSVDPWTDEFDRFLSAHGRSLEDAGVHTYIVDEIWDAERLKVYGGYYLSDHDDQDIMLILLDLRQGSDNTLTHELGHTFGLDHEPDSDNIMYSGVIVNEPTVYEEQLSTVALTALRYLPSGGGWQATEETRQCTCDAD